MTYHDYIVIGAGLGGVRMSYFLEHAGRNYLTLVVPPWVHTT